MKIIYANRVNLSGLYSKKAIQLKLNHAGDDYFVDKGGDFIVETKDIGIVGSGPKRYIQFSSENKDEVELWTSGALAVMNMLGEWAGK